ncbi:MAG: pyridoxal phosphate-dependent aminotransferase [Candidatus Latescibacteria bacterium]|nr:pyridoxal phosphate-dependent aminotransferase [Candidatus Latescibacterota bacterium]
MQAVQSPVIPDVAALIRANPGTISLGQGVVHYPPPPQVFEAVARFGGEVSQHHYHAATGLPQLQDHLRAKLADQNDLGVGQDQFLMVTAGSNMAFYHSILALADPGDEIVLMAPFYFNHEMAVVMANCRPVLVPTDQYYQLRLDAVAAALTRRTRAVVTISPNNPTGAVYDPAALQALNQLCAERGIYHISDEAYEYFTYDGVRHFSPGSLTASRGHTISLFSFSKAFNLASWRVGYMVAPRPLLPALEKIQDTILICPPAVSQAAALGALQAGRDYCQPYVEVIARMRRLCLERLQGLGVYCQVPPADGALYLLVRLQTPLSSMELVRALIERFGVAVIPGTAFGLHQGCYIRVAYGGLPPEQVEEGLDRLVDGLTSLLA